MRRRDRGTRKFYGRRSVSTYPAEKIYEEIAFIAYYTHWSHDEIMSLSHGDRLRWCREISKINSKLNQEPENVFQI
ncbi:DUF6760 family protein [Bacilliculturomica massiliensis]|uniref:DUF6760 family protein n=1 Tax=Bacilliculturomica massiliensis TaxID=1917867 RepID=UPI0013EF5BAF